MAEAEQLSVEVSPVAPAPAATPEPVAPAPGTTETQKGEVNTQAEEKSFTQAELNEIIQKEKAKAESKAERRALKAYKETLERLIPQRQATEAASTVRPERAKFSTDEEWVEAVADWKIAERDKSGRAERAQEQQRTMVDRTEALYAQAQKLPAFDRAAFDDLPLTQVIASAVIESDIAPRLMTFMAENPEEVARIAKLSPARQAAELGRMEAKILSAPPPAQVSKAPAPIEPIGTNRAASTKDPSDMSQKEFEKWRKEQIARRGSG